MSATRRGVLIVGLVGLAAGSILALRILAPNDWNPSTTIKFGEVFPEQNAYAEELLGPIIVAPAAGHDGKFFFSQAMDPFYLEPGVHSIYLDRPTYRAQRMLYPTLASMGGILGATGTAWGLIVVNVLAMGVGTAITARLAIEMGISPWFGLAFLLNPGLMVDINIDSAGLLATAALMGAVLTAMWDRTWATGVLLSVAALARETMLLAAVGLAIYFIWQKRKAPVALVLPFLAVGGWWAYVHWRLSDGLAQDTQALGMPLVGFLEALQGWMSTPDRLADILIGFVLLFASVAVAVRAVLRPTALGLAVAPFALLGLLLSEPVWARYFDSARALAPVLTAYILLVPASLAEKRASASHLASGPAGKTESSA
jgi:hypothetical protein